MNFLESDSLQDRHDKLWQEYKAARVVIDNLHAVIEDLTEEVRRTHGDLDLIRLYCGEHAASASIEARTKALIVAIPAIVDHALGDTLSGGEEAYEIFRTHAAEFWANDKG